MGMRIPPLEVTITLESSPLKFVILVRRLAVRHAGANRPVSRDSRGITNTDTQTVYTMI